jgi:ligand-binding sensor domain-containing protein/serine phosphatase RsbU (regulator of sigma subunit)
MNVRRFFHITLCVLTIIGNSCREQKKDELISEESDTVITEVLDDDMITGTPLPIQEKFIHPDSIVPPTVVKAGEPFYKKAHKNIQSVEQPIIKLISPNLPTFKIGRDSIKEPVITEAVKVEKKSGYNEPQPASKFDFNDAASYNIQGIDVDQGLSSSYVIDIIEDQRGNIWFSTFFAGVTMYNGRSFIMFDEDKGMLSNYVWCIYEDSKGRIWFGTDGGGVCMYDGEIYTDYGTESGISSGLVKDIVEDRNGDIWFATGEGLCKLDGENFYTYSTDQGLSGESVLSLQIDDDGNIWMAIEGGGINKYDGESITHYTESEGLISNWVNSIYIDSEENLWIGTLNAGVCMYDGYSFITYQEDMGLPNNSVNAILEDEQGNMWFATEGGGAAMFNRFEFRNFTSLEGMSNNFIRSLHEDSYGNIWFGTFGAGANIYNERSFENYSESQGLSDHIVRNILQDRDGYLWFATNSGISKYNGKEFWNYTEEQGLVMNIVRVLLEASNGDIWLGYNGGGVSRFDGEYFYHYDTDNGLSGDFIMSIFEDSQENIWIGTYLGGVTKFDGEKFSHITMEEGLANNTVHAIVEDSAGVIYFGTKGGGIDKYDGETIVHNTREHENLSDNNIISMIVSRDGSIWAGSDGFGLNHILEDTIINYRLPGSNSHNIIWSIVEDNNGELWLGTERGLNNFYLDDSLNEVISNYGKLDGLKGSDFYPSSAVLDDENRIWWGTGKSLAMLDLNKYEQMQKAPTIQITDIRLEQAFIDYRRLKDSIEAELDPRLPGDREISLSQVEYSGVTPFTNCPEQLELPYYLNHITFYFSGIDWSAPHKVRYQYKLQGLDAHWRPITDENWAVYSFVEPGEYIFKVRAIGDSNIWSEVKSYPVIIHPPWWTTMWAKASYVILGALLIFLVIRIRTARLLEDQRQLEEVVKARTREVVQQKELVEHKNMEITASITYAQRIQTAILPSKNLIDQHLKDSFFIYMPKDIVAGDFYWMETSNKEILLAAADCTGHGVPGAMVSVVCNNALNRTVREFMLKQPGDILNKVRDLVIETFDTTEEVKDGMDIALVSLNTETLELKYAGANNNLYLIRNGEFEEIQADRMPVGRYLVKKDFAEHTFQLKEGDIFYIFTDGYADQFGGPKGKKFKYSSFKKILLENKDLPMEQQAEKLTSSLKMWMASASNKSTTFV